MTRTGVRVRAPLNRVQRFGRGVTFFLSDPPSLLPKPLNVIRQSLTPPKPSHGDWDQTRKSRPTKLVVSMWFKNETNLPTMVGMLDTIKPELKKAPCKLHGQVVSSEPPPSPPPPQKLVTLPLHPKLTLNFFFLPSPCFTPTFSPPLRTHTTTEPKHIVRAYVKAPPDRRPATFSSKAGSRSENGGLGFGV